MSSIDAWAPQGALTLQTVGALRETARAQAAASGRVDLAGVGEADSAALALLIDLLRVAKAAGDKLEILNLPAGLMALAALYDIGDLLTADSTEA